MNKRVKKKWIILITVIVVVAAFDGLSSNINLLDRAIVVGTGIDIEDGDLVLSAQVIVPKNSASASAGNDFVVYTARGKTVQQAIENLSYTVGLKASFAHTNVVILGDKLLKSGRTDILEFLVKSDIVTDNTLLVASAGEAKEILAVQMPINEVASYHLTEILQSNRKEAGQNTSSLKGYFEDIYKVGETACIPLVFLRESEFGLLGEGADGEKTKLLDVSHVVLTNKEGYLVRLGRRQSAALSYTTEKLNAGSIAYDGDDGTEKEAIILRTECAKRAISYEEVAIDLNFSVRPSEKYYVSKDGSVSGISEKEKLAISAEIITAIADCFEVCKYYDADVFHLGEELYRKFGEEWKMSVGKTYLDDLKLKISVNVNVK